MSAEHDFENLIGEALNIDVFSYNSEVTANVWGVIKILGLSKEHQERGDYDYPSFNTDIAKTLGLTESHVELIQYIICNNDHAEYGTSPRGCWLTDKGFALYKRLRQFGYAKELDVQVPTGSEEK